jgi:hypothetical protein
MCQFGNNKRRTEEVVKSFRCELLLLRFRGENNLRPLDKALKALNAPLPVRKAKYQLFDKEKESINGAVESVQVTMNAATEAISGINEVIDQLKTTLPNADNSIFKIGDAADKIAELGGTMTNAIQSGIESLKVSFGEVATGTSWVASLWEYLSGALYILATTAMAAPKFRVDQFFTSIIFVFGKKIMSHIISLMGCDLPRLFQRFTTSMGGGDVQTSPPAVEGDSAESPDAAEYQFGLPELGTKSLVAIICTLFSAVFLYVTGESVFDLDKTIKYYGDKCRNLNNIHLFFDKTCPLFAWVAEWMVTAITGPKADAEITAAVYEYEQWANAVLFMLRVRPDGKTTVDLIRTDKKTVFFVDELYRKGIHISKELAKYKEVSTTQFHKLFKAVEGWRRLCDHTGIFGDKPRRTPLIVYLYGNSGVGKSQLMFPFASDLMAASHSDLADFASEIYMRNPEQIFWDGYHGQIVCIYDDILQLLDSKTNPNPELMELIRTGNTVPFNLHMAELHEKARARFCSEIVLATANKAPSRYTMESITKPEAFFRRIDVCAEVKVKEEFSKEVQVHNDTYRALDVSKCEGSLDMRVYEFHLKDSATDTPIMKEGVPVVLDYEEFSALCIKKNSQKSKLGEVINAELSERMTPERRAKLAAIAAQYQCDDGKTCGGACKNAESDPQKKWIDVSQFNQCVDAMLERAQTDLEEVVVEDSFLSKIKASVQSYATALKARMSGILTIRNALIAVGLLAASLGIWKLFSKGFERPRRQQSAVSVEERFRHAVEEAMVSGDPRTQRLARVVAELDAQGPEVLAPIPADLPEDPEKPALVHKLESRFPFLKTLCHTVNLLAQTEAACSSDVVTKVAANARVETHVSADAKTVKAPSVVREASGSNDARTVVAPRVLPEAKVSSDAVTSKSPQMIREAQVSGDSLTQFQPKGKMEMWQDKTAEDLVGNRIWGNLYSATVVLNEGVGPKLNGLFVRDNIFLTAAHLLTKFKPGTSLLLQNCLDKTFTVPFEAVKISRLAFSNGDEKDAILIQMPRSVNCHTDLVKHFQTSEEMNYTRAAAVLPTVRKESGSLVRHVLATSEIVAEDASVTFDGVVKTYRHTLCSNLPTKAGDCGSPVILQNNKILRKIVGIHSFALESGVRTYAMNITQDDLLRAFTQFREVHVHDIDGLPHMQLATGSYQFEHPLGVSKLGFAGLCSRPPNAPMKSDLRPSIIHGEIFEPTTAPSVLYDREVDVLQKGVAKAAISTPYLPQKEVDSAVEEVKNQLYKGSHRSGNFRRVLTPMEAVQGLSEECEYIGPIDRRTSPGYPWVLIRKGVGKQCFLGCDDRYFIREDLQERIQQRYELATEGIRAPTVWVDTLKDERRTLDKIKAKKTRVFSCGPQDFTILFRMFFLGFIAHIMLNRIGNEQSIGTNPFGPDWGMTARKLSQKGPAVIAGDFSSFDGTLNAQIMWAFVGVANEWYNDGDENATVRRTLMLDVINSVHLCRNVYYDCDHSQPSGNPATTIINSFYNSVSMRMVFARCVPKGIRFSDTVSMVSYGDDNVVNIDESILPFFNQQTITSGYATIGMIYTDETKSSSTIPFRSIGEVTYLKRYFKKDGGDWLCPQEFIATVETMNWIRDCSSHRDQTLSNCSVVIRELFYHGEDIFHKYVPMINAVCLDKIGERPVQLTFEGYADERLQEHFK